MGLYSFLHKIRITDKGIVYVFDGADSISAHQKCACFRRGGQWLFAPEADNPDKMKSPPGFETRGGKLSVASFLIFAIMHNTTPLMRSSLCIISADALVWL